MNHPCPNCGYKVPTYSLLVKEDGGSEQLVSARFNYNPKEGVTRFWFKHESGESLLKTPGICFKDTMVAIKDAEAFLTNIGFKKEA